MRVFKKDGTLAGYIPIEPPNLIDSFLKDAEENFESAAPVVIRKREVGLVVPAKKTKELRLFCRKKPLNKHSHFELSFGDPNILK